MAGRGRAREPSSQRLGHDRPCAGTCRSSAGHFFNSTQPLYFVPVVCQAPLNAYPCLAYHRPQSVILSFVPDENSSSSPKPANYWVFSAGKVVNWTLGVAQREANKQTPRGGNGYGEDGWLDSSSPCLMTLSRPLFPACLSPLLAPALKESLAGASGLMRTLGATYTGREK